jgi:hypothetical protein
MPSAFRLALLAVLASTMFAGYARAANETVVYSFKGGPDGAAPSAALTELDGVL